MKKRPPYNQEAAIRGALRRAFSRSPIVQEVMAASRREVPRFNKDGSQHKKNWVQRQCEVCDQWVSTSKMAVDHKIPVISVDHGKQSWDEFIARLWCDKSNLQRICDPCHDKKTQEERITRLLIKYTAELDDIANSMNALGPSRSLSDLKKILSKYTSKKKTIGLEMIVMRANFLKQLVISYEKLHKVRNK